MSTVTGGPGNIIKDGLVLWLDAANPRSYPPPYNDTTWADLSGNNNITTLLNYGSKTIYNSLNGGTILFDGTNTFGRISYNANFNLSNTSYTLEGWFKSNSFSSSQIVISKDTFGANFDWCLNIQTSTILRILSNGATTSVTATVPAMSINTWYHFVITSISNTIRIYLNGTLRNTGTMSTTNANLSFLSVGCSGWNSPNTTMNGNISSVRVYRKGLSNTEILQNFNSTRSRFGI